MQNTKGIILNGEWLGTNVVINDMFNAICSISPLAMQEFLHLVNDIDELDNAIIINDFSYNNKNLLDINFSNSDIRGIASLLFKMDGSRQRMLNCFFKIDSINSDMTEGKRSKSENNKKSKTASFDGEYENLSGEESSYVTKPEAGYPDIYDNDYDEDDEYNTDDNYNSYKEEGERVIGRKRSNKPRRHNRRDYYYNYDDYDGYDEYGYNDGYYEEDDYEDYDDESESSDVPYRPRRRPKKHHIHTDRRHTENYDEYDYDEEDYEEEDYEEDNYEDYDKESESSDTSYRPRRRPKKHHIHTDRKQTENHDEYDYDEEDYEEGDYEEDDHEGYDEGSESLDVQHKPNKKSKKPLQNTTVNVGETENSEEDAEEAVADEKEEISETEEYGEVSESSELRRQPKKERREKRRNPSLSRSEREDFNEVAKEEDKDDEGEDSRSGRSRRDQMRPRRDMRDSGRNDIASRERIERPPRSRADKDLGMDYKELIIRANNINITCDGGNIPDALMKSGMVSQGGGYSGGQMPQGGGYGGGQMPQGDGYGSGQMPQGNGYGGMPPNMGNWPGMWNGPVGQGQYPGSGNLQDMSLMDEIRNLKTELMTMAQQGAQGTGEPVKKERMTLEEYLEQQRSKESKANEYSEGFRIIGSKKRLKVDALDNNFFVADNKVYKWGEMRKLDW